MKLGYKQTDVGVIPEEWACEPLSAFLAFISYGFTNPMPTVHSGVFMITAADIYDGRLQLETARRTSESAYRTLLTAKSKPRQNDLLLTKDGTLGRLALVGGEPICINQSVAVMRPNERVEPQFLKMLLESPHYQARMIEDAGGSTIKHIYITIVDKMPVGLPYDKVEQRAIANALSDVDELLSGLDRLIAKKRDLKQAAMQQLLTGQTRLPGFRGKDGFQKSEVGLIPNDWNCLRVPQVVSSNTNSIKIGPFGSALKKEYLVSRGYKVYGQENIYAKDMALGDRYISSSHFMELRACEIRPGDFLISMMGTVGKCLVAPPEIEAGIMDSHLLRLRLNPEIIAATFLMHLFETIIVFRQVKQLSVGGIMEGLSSKIIRGISLPIPSVYEQIAIANVLTEMDTELAALEQRREKTRALKQAMMQELLTGRTRLI